MQVLLLAVLLTVMPQQPAPAGLEGVVVNRVTGQPLAATTVDLFEDGNAQRVTTGADGTFRFSNVAPGNDYHLVAIHSGSYLPFEYGQQTPTGPGRLLELAPGQALSGLRLEITPTGTISGRVVDRDGEPLARGAVHALQIVRQNGADVQTIVQSVLTNDRGEYRLFWLAPGTYTITAVARGWGTFAVAEPGLFGTRTEVYSPTIIERVQPDGTIVKEVARTVSYPQSINLQAGASRTNIDMTAEFGPTRKIAGTVVMEAAGQSSNGLIVEAKADGSELFFNAQTSVENGRFALTGILPGSYVVSLRGPVGDVRIPVEVGNSDIENLQIVARPSPGAATTLQPSQSSVMALQQQPASLQGVVVDSVTGAPLSKVRVVFSLNVPTAQAHTILTGADGRFSFENVPAGTYRMLATRASGYMQTQYLQRMPEREGLPIPLSPGQRLTGVKLEMTPFAAISGRILDSKGEPVGNAAVSVVRIQHRQSNQIVEGVQNTTSNDLGEYRFFELPPGRYSLRVEPPPLRRPLQGTNFFMTTNHGGPRIVSLLAPAATPPPRPEIPQNGITYAAVNSASPIDLSAGQDLKGIDIPISLTPRPRVSGQLINGLTGLPAQVFTLQPYSLLGLGYVGPVLDPRTGTFTFEGMDPGSYTLTAKTSDGLSARILLDVSANSNLDNVRLTLLPEVELSGRVVAEGTLAGNLDARNITSLLELTPWDSGSTPYARPQDGSGSFVMKNVMPGVEYGLRVDSTLTLRNNNAFVKTVRFKGVEILDTFRVESPPQGLLEVVLSSDGGAVAGTVGEPNVTVVLVPDQNRGRAYAYHYLVSDLIGAFRFPNVAPGNYKVFAWKQVEWGAWRNADFLREFEDRGAPVRVNEGGTATVTVPVN